MDKHFGRSRGMGVKQISLGLILAALLMLNGTAVRTEAEDTTPAPVTYAAEMEAEAPVCGADAECAERSNARNRRIRVTIDGMEYAGEAFLYKETTYVGFREFSVAIAGASVSWNGSTATATAKTDSITVSARKGQEYISSNGRYFWTRHRVIIEDGTTYVPIRALTAAFGGSLTWNGKNYSVAVKRGSSGVVPGGSYYDSDELYWLSRIISAESRGESLTGKIAVGNVVLNRTRSSDYPDTIYEVIFDRKYGVQFSPVADGSIYSEPTAESVIAAKLCLEGYSVSDTILFFINAAAAENFWVTSRPLEVSIGRHDFYA